MLLLSISVAHAGDGAAAPAEAEKLAYERARPVFEKYCAACHTSTGAKATKKQLRHFNMDRYPFGGHHADEIGDAIRVVLGVNGEKPTMPKNKPGAVKGRDLDIVAEWSKAWDAAHAGDAHPGHRH